MSQELLYAVLPRAFASPRDLVYRRRVPGTDRGQKYAGRDGGGQPLMPDSDHESDGGFVTMTPDEKHTSRKRLVDERV